MALIEKLKAIGDAIRGRTGTTGKMSLDEMAEMINSMEVGSDDVSAYILIDENGVEYPAVLVDEPVTLTANPVTDIRKGTTAVTEAGVVTGEKEIPVYYTKEGTTAIPAGSAMKIKMYSDRCNYTKLQALICAFNTNVTNSVSTEKVSIDSKVYNVGSTDVVSEVTVDSKNQSIDLGILNTSNKPIIIRYFTFTEE
jgi:hypothetical protein